MSDPQIPVPLRARVSPREVYDESHRAIRPQAG